MNLNFAIAVLLAQLVTAPKGTTIVLSGGEHGGEEVAWAPTSKDSGLEVMKLPDGCKYRLVKEPKGKPAVQAVFIGGAE